MAGYIASRLQDIDEQDDGRCPYRPVRHHFGITAFGINVFTGHAVGDRILNEHDEDEGDAQQELYLVLQGTAEFRVGDESFDASPRTFVRIDSGVTRTAFAREPNTTILAVGATPGVVYEPSGWEVWSPVRPLYDAGRYDEAADRGRELLGGDPPYAELYYNVACCEALAGRHDDAIAHLRHAIDLSAVTRSYAEEDSDLDALRDTPAFKELLADA